MQQVTFHYAGFWSRFWAGLIDTMILWVVSLLFSIVGHQGRWFALAMALPQGMFHSLYELDLHARYGQTIGKRVMGIKVLRVDGKEIGWHEAAIRSSVNLILAALITLTSIYGLLMITNDQYAAGTANGFWDSSSTESLALQAQMQVIPHWFWIVFLVWEISEVVTLLFNKQKRAVHDLMAGTIVVHVDEDGIPK